MRGPRKKCDCCHTRQVAPEALPPIRVVVKGSRRFTSLPRRSLRSNSNLRWHPKAADASAESTRASISAVGCRISWHTCRSPSTQPYLSLIPAPPEPPSTLDCPPRQAGKVISTRASGLVGLDPLHRCIALDERGVNRACAVAVQCRPASCSARLSLLHHFNNTAFSWKDHNSDDQWTVVSKGTLVGQRRHQITDVTTRPRSRRPCRRWMSSCCQS